MDNKNITDEIEILTILSDYTILHSFQEISITQDLMFILPVCLYNFGVCVHSPKEYIASACIS